MTPLALMMTLALGAPAEVVLDFSDQAALEAVVREGRQTWREEGHMLLRGGSSMYLKQPTGIGTYHVRFTMVEAEKFQYHVPSLQLFRADPADPHSDGYSLMWRRYGLLVFSGTVGGEQVHSRQFIDPGRDNPNRYESGEQIDLTVRVPAEGDCIEVYCHSAEADGEPTCRFKLIDELPLEGHFGWRNTKWFSHARIHQLAYRPLQ